MQENKLKSIPKGAVKKLRELYEKRRGKPSPELIEILKKPDHKKDNNKKSALPESDQDLDI